MILQTKYSFGDILYLKTDTDQKKRMLIGVNFKKGITLYELACGVSSSWHQEEELCEEVDILSKIISE